MIASVAALQEFPNKTKCLTHVPPIAAIAKIVPSHPRHPRVSLTRGSHLGDLGLVRCGQISIAGSLGLALLGLRGRGGEGSHAWQPDWCHRQALLGLCVRGRTGGLIGLDCREGRQLGRSASQCRRLLRLSVLGLPAFEEARFTHLPLTHPSPRPLLPSSPSPLTCPFVPQPFTMDSPERS